MKKFLSLVAFLTITVAGFAQDVDNFEVGPYEVEYKGSGDYKFRLRKGVDLYEYFGLKKDTIIERPTMVRQPVAVAWQLGAQYGLHGYGLAGSTNKFGITGSYKLRLGSQIYFNAGANVALGLGDYGSIWNNMSETMFEAGLPLSIELADINREKASLYGMIGVVPTFFTSLSNSNDSGVDFYDALNMSKSGFFIAPVLGLGAYVPCSGKLLRIGAFVQYDILFKDYDSNVYARRIGRTVLGAEIGIVF